MAITIDDFAKVWASQSPLTPYEFSESQYKEGWNFIGGTPPSRQMWDFLQNQNDEKSQWLYNAHNDILDLLKKLIPTGCVQAFAGNTLPDGWLLCDGSAVLRTDYAELYAVIGTTYGAGDGSTTFNLPNLTDKFIEGSATAGTEKAAGLPEISGSLSIRSATGSDTFVNLFTPATSALYGNEPETWAGDHSVLQAVSTNPASIQQVNLSAQRNNAIYGGSNTVQPPALTMRYIIKY